MGQDLFFYGTLRHRPLLDVVLGADAQTLDISPAQLDGYQVYAVSEGPFPTIQPQAGAVAQGLLVKGLSDAHLARLNFYEGSFEYDLVDGTLADGTAAQFYMSQPGQWTATQPWSLEAWTAVHGVTNQYAAEEVMSYFGALPRERVAALFGRIRARAGSRARAQASQHGKDTLHGQVEISQRARVHNGFYAFDTLSLRHALFDGTWSEVLAREVFVPSDAAMVLPYDPRRDCVLVVEQVRLGPLARGDRTLWQWEPIAGIIDPGETPETTAHREAQEEAGVTLRALEPVARTYTSPGNSADFAYIFVGIADLPEDSASIGGLASEGEDIRSHILSFDDLMERVETFDIVNGPLVTCALWLDRHRGRLRSP